MSDAIRGKPFTGGSPLPAAPAGEQGGMKEIPAKSNNPALNVKSYQQGQAPLPRPANQPGAQRLLGDRTITVAQGATADAIRAKRAEALRMASGDSKSVGARPHQASAVETDPKTETNSAPAGVASNKEAANRKALEGIKQSKAQLAGYVSRHAGALPKEDIARMVGQAILAATRDPELSAKLSSASLEPFELEALAKEAVKRTIA